MFWLRKLAAVVSVSLGIAFLLLPFPAELEGEREVEVVRLEVGPPPFSEATARERFGDSLLLLSSESLEPLPELRDAVLGLMGESGGRCVTAGEWQAALSEWAPVTPVGAGYAFRDGLYEITAATAETNALGDEIVCFDVAHLGAYDNPDWSPMSRPDPGDLDGYPELKTALEGLAAGPLGVIDGHDVPKSQWRRFHRRHLDDLEFRPAFVVLDRLFRGSVGKELMPWSLATPWLEPAAQVAGGVLLLLGAVLLVGTYRESASRPGIAVASPALAVLCDGIALAGGAFVVTLAIDTVWVGPLGQPSLLGLAPEWPSDQAITGLHFVSVPGILIALPLLTLFFTSLSAQRVEVSRDGVTSHGALGSVTVPWGDLERVGLREQRNPFAFTVVDFRKLQTVLDLEGAECALTINEPGSRSRKARIVDALREHAPEEKRDLLADLEGW